LLLALFILLVALNTSYDRSPHLPFNSNELDGLFGRT